MFTSFKQKRASIEPSRHYDHVTGKLDRVSLFEELKRIITNTDKQHNVVFGIANIEQFKLVNYAYGNAVGDFALKEISRRMQVKFSDETIIGRIGNDEFGFICEMEIYDVKKRCEELNTSFNKAPLYWEGKSLNVHLSFGIVTVEQHIRDVDSIVKAANEAVYSAQYDGRDTICEYDANDTAILRRSGNLQHAISLSQSIVHDQFLLYVQPIVGLFEPRTIRHYEVLIRGQMKNGSVVPPENYINAAEDFNITTKLDKWVIRNLFKWLNIKSKVIPKTSVFSVNISALSVNDNELSDYIIELMKKENIDPKQVCFEITEHMAIKNINRCRDFMRTLREVGFTFALDDFGTGYCSFKYIKSLPFDIIKVDRSFVNSINTDPINQAIVKAIADICRIYNKKAVAEGIENKAAEQIVNKLGVQYGQGYLYAKPFPIDLLVKVYKNKR